MNSVRLLATLLLLAFAWGPARAQPADPGFGEAVLGAPPSEETGPLERKRVPFGVDPAPAEASPTTTEAAVQPESQPTSSIQAYANGLFAGLVGSGQLPGAALIIIQDGAVVHKAGYGLADIRSKTPVDPDVTRFRVASVSKLFTATAVMQAVEQGKVDLNADVNTYLSSFKVGTNFPEPVTLANLLTHTAGFDDRYRGLAAPLSAPTEPLSQHLSRALPPRVLPPNSVIAYSNYGIGVAGQVVEAVTGEEFAAYVGTHVLAPLGMTSSSFGIPYPIPATIAVPYFPSGEEGGFRRGQLDQVRVGPAGDLITTAADMSKFMLMQLNRGATPEGQQILSETQVERMQARHFANADGLDGWAYGFATGARNGISWIGHDGAWNGFCAQLVLHPESKSGFFVVTNAECRLTTSLAIRDGLFNALWPRASVVQAAQWPDADQRAQAAKGTYMTVRRARSDFTVLAAAASEVSVDAVPGGSLSVRIPGLEHALQFVPQENGTWMNAEHQWKAAWRPAATGEPARFMIDTQAYDRVTGLGVWSVWSVALALIVAICIMTMWGWANGFLSRHLFGEPQAVITFGPRMTGFLAAGLILATLVSMVALLSDAAPLAIIHGPSPMLMILLTVPVIVGVLAVPMIVWSVTGFGAGPRARFAQAGYIVLTLAVLTFLAFCVQWNFHPLSIFTG